MANKQWSVHLAVVVAAFALASRAGFAADQFKTQCSRDNEGFEEIEAAIKRIGRQPRRVGDVSRQLSYIFHYKGSSLKLTAWESTPCVLTVMVQPSPPSTRSDAADAMSSATDRLRSILDRASCSNTQCAEDREKADLAACEKARASQSVEGWIEYRQQFAYGRCEREASKALACVGARRADNKQAWETYLAGRVRTSACDNSAWERLAELEALERAEHCAEVVSAWRMDKSSPESSDDHACLVEGLSEQERTLFDQERAAHAAKVQSAANERALRQRAQIDLGTYLGAKQMEMRTGMFPDAEMEASIRRDVAFFLERDGHLAELSQVLADPTYRKFVGFDSRVFAPCMVSVAQCPAVDLSGLFEMARNDVNQAPLGCPELGTLLSGEPASTSPEQLSGSVAQALEACDSRGPAVLGRIESLNSAALGGGVRRMASAPDPSCQQHSLHAAHSEAVLTRYSKGGGRSDVRPYSGSLTCMSGFESPFGVHQAVVRCNAVNGRVVERCTTTSGWVILATEAGAERCETSCGEVVTGSCEPVHGEHPRCRPR